MDRLQEIKKARHLLYREHATIEDLLKVADEICSHQVPIHGSVFSATASLEVLTGSFALGRRRERGFTASARPPYLLSLPASRSSSASHQRPTSFMWTDDSDKTVFLIGLADDFHLFWSEFQKYFRTELSMLYLRTSDFQRAFSALGDTMCMTGYTANVLHDNNQKVKTRREWFTRPKPQDEFFAELETERQWLRSLEIVTEAPDTRGRVKRDMSFSCQQGFQAFLSEVLGSLRATAVEARGIMTNRAATNSPTQAPRPLQLFYADSLLADKSQNHRLIRVLRKLPDASISVYHPNPFLHASVVDYMDGSSYAIWITDSTAITVIPELKATTQSLGRLFNHINEHFGEGTIRDIAS